MLDHIAEQVGVKKSVIAGFARRTPTRYDQLASIKMRFGFRDLSRPLRGDLMVWLTGVAMPATAGRALLDRLLAEMRQRRIVVPGISVVERMAAEAMHRAETDLTAAIGRAYLRARKRPEQRTAVSNNEGRERLLRVSAVLEAMVRAARAGDDVTAVVNAIASLDKLDADCPPRGSPTYCYSLINGVWEHDRSAAPSGLSRL